MHPCLNPETARWICMNFFVRKVCTKSCNENLVLIKINPYESLLHTKTNYFLHFTKCISNQKVFQIKIRTLNKANYLCHVCMKMCF